MTTLESSCAVRMRDPGRVWQSVKTAGQSLRANGIVPVHSSDGSRTQSGNFVRHYRASQAIEKACNMNWGVRQCCSEGGLGSDHARFFITWKSELGHKRRSMIRRPITCYVEFIGDVQRIQDTGTCHCGPHDQQSASMITRQRHRRGETRPQREPCCPSSCQNDAKGT